jgi:hypothetical protein
VLKKQEKVYFPIADTFFFDYIENNHYKYLNRRNFMSVMTAKQVAEYKKMFGFEKVRKRHGENERRQDEQSEKTERKLAELRRETERAIREAGEQGQKTDRRIAEVTKAIGEMYNSAGEPVETLVSARIWKKFRGYRMDRVFRRVPVYDGDNRRVAEVDALLSGAVRAIAVEVKQRLQKRNVDFHVKRLELVQKYPPAEIKLGSKMLMGAVAGITVPSKVRDYAHENGLFVIELSGETARLVPPPVGFKPREWA